jgi:hypothetical protein
MAGSRHRQRAKAGGNSYSPGLRPPRPFSTPPDSRSCIPHHVTQPGNRCPRSFFRDGDCEACLERIAEWCLRCSRRINLREGWRGHLWQRRFASSPMSIARSGAPKSVWCPQI